jgi:nucleotide-binding universal stress UspA family protein
LKKARRLRKWADGRAEERAMLKDLIVHLDGSPEDEARLVHAEAIAKAHGAHVAGLYTNLLPEYFMATGFDPAFSTVAGIVELQERMHEEGVRTAKRLRERLAKIDASSEFRSVEAGASELNARCASEARWADLFVATARSEAGAIDWGDMIETIIFEAGRAVYLAPPGGNPAPGVRNALVAWRDTRESARAVAEALPFLKGSATRIVTVRPKGGEEPDDRAADVAAHLARHGAKVEVNAVDAHGATTASVLLGEARRMEADLIVMGAYGHSRFREWVLGGVTRDMIAKSDKPLLIAH